MATYKADIVVDGETVQTVEGSPAELGKLVASEWWGRGGRLRYYGEWTAAEEAAYVAAMEQVRGGVIIDREEAE